MADVRDTIFGMSGCAREVMRCLFFHGPTEDGDIPSKTGRGELFKMGLVDCGHGLAWLTSKGVEFGVKSMCLDEEKERWARKRRSAA